MPTFTNKKKMEFISFKSENEWTIKTLSTITYRHYSPEKELICPEKPKRLEVPEDKVDINLLETMETRWSINNEEANKFLAKTIRITTAKYKDTVSKLTARMTLALLQLQKEFDEKKERNVDNILKRQIAWNNEIEEWVHSVTESGRIIQFYILKYLPNYQQKLLKVGYLNLNDMNSLLNRFIFQVNQIIVGNQQRIAEVEFKLKLIFDTMIVRDIAQVYYRVLLESKQQVQKLEDSSVKKSEMRGSNQWRRILYDEFIEILRLLEERLPMFTKIPEMSIYITHIYKCIKQAFKYGRFEVGLIHNQIMKLDEEIKLGEADKSDMLIWTNLASLARSSLMLTRKIALQGIHLWNQTISRIELVKVLIKTTVDQQKTINIFNEEVSLNILLDKLRECPELKLINGIYQKIDNILKKYEKRIRYVNEDELKLIKTATKSSNVCANVFEANRQFLNEYYLDAENALIEEASTMFRLLKFNPETDKAIQKIIMHENSAKTWRTAFFDNLRIASIELKNIVSILFDDWANSLRIDAVEWNQRLLNCVRCRRKRILSDIVDVRAAELQEHDQRIKRHVAGFYNECADLIRLDGMKSNMLILNNEMEISMRELLAVNELNVRRINELIERIKRIKRENQGKKQYLIKRETENMERKFYWMTVANKHFLKSIRFFGENGNFAPKEAQILVMAVQRLESNIPAQKNLVYKNIKAVEEEYKIKPHIVLATIRKMQFKNAEITFKEFLVNELDEVCSAIKRECGYLISSLRQLEDWARKLSKWESQSIDDYFLRLQKFSTYLYIPIETKRLEIEIPEKKVKDRKVAVKSGSGSQDYVENLMEGTKFKPKSKKGLFLYNTKFLLHHSLQEIQKKAKSFFGKAKNMKKKKKNASNTAGSDSVKLYKKLMETLVTIFKGYNLQCELYWLESIFDFIGLMILIRRRFVTYATNCINTDTHWWKLKLNHIIKQYVKRTKFITNKELAERKALDNELKPWHGYPGKRYLLEKLAVRVTQHSRYNIKKLATRFKKYKIQLRNVLKQYTTSGAELFADLNGLKSKIRSRKLDKFFANFTTFVDRYMNAYYRSQVLIKPDDENQLLEPKIDYLLEPGGVNKLVHFPSSEVLVINEEGFSLNYDDKTKKSGEIRQSETPSIDSHLLGPVHITVKGIIIKTGLSPIFELVNKIVSALKNIYKYEINFKKDLVPPKGLTLQQLKNELKQNYDQELFSKRIDIDLDKEFNYQKKILKYQCSSNILNSMKNLEALIKQIEMWHTKWAFDIKAIKKLYELTPFYNNSNSLIAK
ncbi:hypothetical protein O3M35_000109 [Rhynocoris fuscipes]|uniref:Uncharacterized protein n=1 Tax=Rhynocoris fuscipes TaxID=488301 RepID=A0AAW1DMD0_9HEMI